MAEICRFLGIVIHVIFADHPPPHVHVKYAGQWAHVSIEDGSLLKRTKVPIAILALVRRWLREHRAEVKAAWLDAAAHRHPPKIRPLRGF